MTYKSRFSVLITAGLMAFSTPVSGMEMQYADHTRPMVVIVGNNEFTEITDFLVPYAILSESGAFNVASMSLEEGPVNLWPNLTAEFSTTLATVDQDLPKPPDVIVVPAMHDPDHPALMAWLQKKSARGAFIVSICDGVFVTATAGLLDDKKATGHFFSANKRKKRFKNVNWVEDVLYVESGNIMSTAGVSASLPASLRLVEKFAGVERAQTLAATYGVSDYGPHHDSARFSIGVGDGWTLLKNFVRGNSNYDVVLRDGIDEFSLGFTLDFMSRTLRASV